MAVDRNGPRAFILVPDGEFSAFNPQNDQVWALCLDASDTCPFYFHTTYQLRAKLMRLFPNIIVGHHTLTQPNDFAVIPTVTQYTPSTIEIQYTFTNQLHVRFMGFIIEPDALVGTIEIKHSGDEPIELECELAAILIPMGKGNPTHPEAAGGNQILSGHTDNIHPVLFISSGPLGTSNPYPALRVPLDMRPGETTRLHWALVSKDSQKISLESARKLASPSWHRTFQIHQKRNDEHMVYVKTGLPDWDAAFLLAQVNALTHLVNLGADTQQPTFIRTRLPDQPLPGISKSEVISDLTLLDALHLFEVLLPAHADHLVKLIEGFIARVDEQGCLSSSIHLGMNGRTINDCPLLANLCLALYEFNHDANFLQQAYPTLRRFFDSGWSADADHDPDALPHWETTTQLQLDSGLFKFEAWEETGQGLDIRTADSPALAAMLHREALALNKIAHILGDRSARTKYGKRAKNFQEKILSLWNDERKMFTYLDRQSHRAPAREIYYPGRIQAKLDIHKQFIQPQRLQVHLTTQDEHPRSRSVCIAGLSVEGEKIVEEIQPPELRWMAGRAHVTTRHLFSVLDSISFEGFNPEDHFLIETADYTQEDISCMLPVWSGGVQKDHLAALCETHLDSQTAQLSSGIPETWRSVYPLPEGLPQQVSILWNTIIIDGITAEGFTQEAMTLFSNLMSSILRGLKEYHGFFRTYNIKDGLPKGQPDSITGLAPLRLFLKIAGIKLMTPDKVAIWGSNPFPWPIELRWQGLWLRREGAQTQIRFPDGTYYQSQATKPLVVTSDKG